MFTLRQVKEPASARRAVLRVIQPATADMGHRQCLVVALNCMEPGLVQPVQRLQALRATVDKITDAEQPVQRRIEINRQQRCLQALKVPVDIAHGIIAPPRIDGKPLDPTHTVLPSPTAPGRRTITVVLTVDLEVNHAPCPDLCRLEPPGVEQPGSNTARRLGRSQLRHT
ncbi:hypothetical protein D3C72_1695720 [compost metagenome]